MPDDFDESLEALLRYWKESPHPTVRLSSYFPAYATLFRHLRGKPCVFIETGILDGGSLFMWKMWLGDGARVIGVDLNPEARKWEASGFEIFIGDQGDPAFWKDLFGRVGPFDVLLDDGGHQYFQQIVTALEAIEAAKKECLVVVEDTTTSFMKDFGFPSRDSFLEFSKAATDALAARTFGVYKDRYPAATNAAAIDCFRNVFSIQFFNGIVAFHVSPARAVDAQIVHNMPSAGASDFRYQGKSFATVPWPNVLQTDLRMVRGGAPAPPAEPNPGRVMRLAKRGVRWIRRFAQRGD